MELPDFEDLQKMIKDISILALEKALVEIELKKGESEIFRRSQIEEAFFQNGKPPSVAYVESAYKYTGLSGEFIPLREKLAKLSSLLESKRLSFDLMKDKIEVWRSEQANNRISLTV